jgi:tetratricopeptide (TPR) repeat protein
MTKGSSRRHARAEGARHFETGARLLKVGKNRDALKSLLDAARLLPDDADILAQLGIAYMLTGRLRQAIDTLRRAVTLRPDAGHVRGRLGAALQAVGDYEAAIAECREAVRLSPELTEAHCRLADMFLQKGRRSEAVEAYERAAALTPGTLDAHLMRSTAYLAMERFGEAEHELREALAIDPSNALALQSLAWVLQATGNPHEAGASYERVIELDPLNAGSYQGLARSRKFTETDRPWIGRILARLENTDWQRKFPPIVADEKLMTFHFALGKIMDDLGDYAEAMHHFDAANQMRRRLGSFDRLTIEQRVDRLTRRFTPEFFAKHKALGNDDPTPVLIVGLPRSGTSLVERVLSSHPQVRGRGELDFWIERGPLWAEAEPAALAKVAGQLSGDYLRVLREQSSDVLRVTDKMPFNFFWVGLAHLLFPNALVVHCRRHPVDTCLSIYMTQFTAVWDFASGLGELTSYFRLYRRLMDHWRIVIPPDRLIEVDYEKLVAEPEATARSLVAFSGLEWNSACLHPERSRQVVSTASVWQARQPIYQSSVARWRHYEPWIRELRELLEPREEGRHADTE